MSSVRAERSDRIQCLLGFVSSVFVCSSVLLDYMKDQKEKTEAMLREFELVKINVEKVMEMCEYTKTLKYTVRQRDLVGNLLRKLLYTYTIYCISIVIAASIRRCSSRSSCPTAGMKNY